MAAEVADVVVLGEPARPSRFLGFACVQAVPPTPVVSPLFPGIAPAVRPDFAGLIADQARITESLRLQGQLNQAQLQAALANQVFIAQALARQGVFLASPFVPTVVDPFRVPGRVFIDP